MIRDKTLKDFLDYLEENLSGNIKLIIIEGNALVLLGFKEFTKDVDLCLFAPHQQVQQLICEYKNKTRVDVDTFYKGIFKNINVKDYSKRATKLDTDYSKLKLYVLDLLDILLTKMDRMIPRDWNDCYYTIKKARINKKDLDQRFQYYLDHYIGSDSDRLRFITNYNIFIDAVKHLLQ